MNPPLADPALLLRLLDSAPAMLGYWNAALRCQFSNAAYADWFGKTRAQMRGIAMHEALGPVFAQNAEQIRGVLAGQAQRFERDVVVADGTLRHSIMSYTPDWQDGRVAGFFVHVADVTELKQTESTLRAAQVELAAVARAHERLRISRDLHDVIGHHLTALNLQLEVALAELDREHAGLRHSRQLAGALLDQVRTVVSQERAVSGDDLGAALRELCRHVPVPAVHLHLGAGLEQIERARADVALCVVREALTNAVRHAGATTMQIYVARQATALTILAQDNGQGTTAAACGNGLTGMQERVAALGGTLSVGPADPCGWSVRATLPAP